MQLISSAKASIIRQGMGCESIWPDLRADQSFHRGEALVNTVVFVSPAFILSVLTIATPAPFICERRHPQEQPEAGLSHFAK
jgi:hypothetical protein